jgi:hypothetical protein
MRKRMMLPIAAVALVGLMTAFATTAQATSDMTSLCTRCHGGANIVVTATLASTTGTNATYNYSAAADTVAVFDGTVAVLSALPASGQFTVATGKTYTVMAVAGPGETDGIGSTTVSPVATVVDTTAPVTTSDAKATYVSSAAIKLTATDAGSGVASTYYKLDGGAQTSGTTVNVAALGAHTIEFWSVDVAGNVELPTTVTFTITEPVVPDPTADLFTVKVHISDKHVRGHVASLTNKVTGEIFTALVDKHGNVVFTEVPAGTYRLSVATDKGEKSLRTIHVRAPEVDDDDDDDDSDHNIGSHQIRED